MEKRCGRIVKKDMLEWNDPNLLRWWTELFKCIDEDEAIPDVQLRSFLLELIPARVVTRLADVMELKEKRFKIAETQGNAEIHETEGHSKKVSSSHVCEPGTSIGSSTLREAGRRTSCSISGSAPPKINPFMRFFKRKPHVAAIWRDAPPKNFNDLSIEEKADLISRQIATDFSNFVHRTLLMDEFDEAEEHYHHIVSVQEIVDMFQIGAQSFEYLKVCPRYMHHVPDQIAMHNLVPEQSRTAVLKREIQRDFKASKRKKKIFAFGGRLPYDMQVKPIKNDKRWLRCTTNKYHEELRTMAGVWQGITHFKITREFCKYMNAKGIKNKPEYLVQCGLMERKRCSEDSTASGSSYLSKEKAGLDFTKSSKDESHEMYLALNQELHTSGAASDGEVITRKSV